MDTDEKDWWTWADFNAAVDGLCPLEVTRIFGQMNADGSSVYYRNQIRQGVLDLCHFIPEYAKSNETIYFNQDFVPDGHAHVGTMPPQAAIESAWFYSTNRMRRYQVKQVQWERRFEMTERERRREKNEDWQFVQTAASLDAICKLRELGDGRHPEFFMAISPRHDAFYLYPQVNGEWLFSMFWSGKKLDYRNEEYVPFHEEAAQAVAWYVASKFAGYVERDAARAQEFAMLYANKRTNLFLDGQAKGFISSHKHSH